MGKQAETIYSCDPWQIAEHTWSAENHAVGESVFSLANEYMGFRDYAEEGAEAKGLVGTYFGGVWEWEDEHTGGYKGIIRRGHHMVCAPDYLFVRIFSAQETVRLNSRSQDYLRFLDLRTGLVHREYTSPLSGGKLHVAFDRLLAMDAFRCAGQRITLTSDTPLSVCLILAIDGGTVHKSVGKCLWQRCDSLTEGNRCAVRFATGTTHQYVDCCFSLFSPVTPEPYEEGDVIGFQVHIDLEPGKPVTLERRILNDVFPEKALDLQKLSGSLSFEDILVQNRSHWDAFWRISDVVIEGDPLNQQGIRYCLFQLHQTYRGLDSRHNIGAKGLTGEVYSGHAFWDSETYCLPYYLYNDPGAARSLLMFRYSTLPQARARAKELDCQGACYPIATINGNEGCALWQHASLQMQPSTAVAYAVMSYAAATGDTDFLFHEGIEMLVDISRYVVSRGDWNADRTGFGFWGVMGPDEFHMMVNNDYYTNDMGRRTLLDTLCVLSQMEDPDALVPPGERSEWKNIADHMIVHQTPEGIFEQHDGYFTLPHLDIRAIPVSDFPLYDHWSYDRIYRTDMIKQPSVLMTMFLHPSDYSKEELAANYDFYEPRCIHESSLSPSVHAVLAQRLGRDQAAADFFRFATRLDLDNYNRNTGDGLHLTSIAAAWVTIVEGFGGLQVDQDGICISPHLPEGWERYTFCFHAGDGVVRAEVTKEGCRLSMAEGTCARLRVYGTWEEVRA